MAIENAPAEAPSGDIAACGAFPKAGMGAGVQNVMPPPPSSDVHKARTGALSEPGLKMVAKAGVGAAPTTFCR